MSYGFELPDPTRAFDKLWFLLRTIGVEAEEPDEQRRRMGRDVRGTSEVNVKNFVLANPRRIKFLIVFTITMSSFLLIVGIVGEFWRDHEIVVNVSLALNSAIALTVLFLCIALLEYVVTSANLIDPNAAINMKFMLAHDTIQTGTGAMGRARWPSSTSTSPGSGDQVLSDEALYAIQERLPRLDESKAEEAELIADYVGQAGETIFAKLRDRLETQHLGKFVQINVMTGEYVVADTLLGSMRNFVTKFGNAPSWGNRIGEV